MAFSPPSPIKGEGKSSEFPLAAGDTTVMTYDTEDETIAQMGNVFEMK